MAAQRQGGSASEARGRLVVENRKARREFEVLETIEAGLVLSGTEVKTLRAGKVSLDESFARVGENEAFLLKAHIEEYTHGNRMNHVPTRPRKLLLRKSQIKKLHQRVTQKGLTLVPLKLYFNERGIAKVELALCRGRKTVDKREVEKRREARREIERYA